MTMLLLALAVTVSPAPPPLTAVPAKPYYRAQLSPTCGEWRAARANALPDAELAVATYSMWVRGFVTGYNVAGPGNPGDLLGGTSKERLHALLDMHCKAHPSDLISDAMPPIAATLAASRPAPPPVGQRRASVAMTMTCGDWAGARDNAMLRLAYGTAVRGYLTAYNLYGPDPTGDVVGSGKDGIVDTWLDGWCAGRPSSLLLFAIHPLIDHLAAERAAGRLPAGGPQPNDRPTPGSQRLPAR